MAVLYSEGKDPERRESLTSSVRDGTRCGRHWEKTDAGIGPSSQDFRGMLLMTDKTSDSDTEWKDRRGVPLKTGSGVVSLVGVLSSFSLICSILDTKKEEKTEGSSEGR